MNLHHGLMQSLDQLVEVKMSSVGFFVFFIFVSNVETEPKAERVRNISPVEFMECDGAQRSGRVHHLFCHRGSSLSYTRFYSLSDMAEPLTQSGLSASVGFDVFMWSQ